MGEKAAKRPYSKFHEGVIKPSKRRESTSTAGPTHLGHFLTLIGLVVLVLLSGGKFVWVKGSFLAIIGLMLVLRPPRATLENKLDWIIRILLVVAAFAFLPAGLLEFLPDILFGRPIWWREVTATGVELPITVTPQPLVALEGFLMLFAGVSYLYLLINCRLKMDDRWRLMQAFVVLGGLLAATVVVGNLMHVQYFWTDRAASFSFFDNRNQTSALLMMVGILALAMTFYAAFKKWYWMPISGLSFLACAFAISMSLSRSGLLLFVIGSGVWVILRFTVMGERGLMRIVAPILAASFCLMLITGQQTLSRFGNWLGAEGNMFADFRWSVYRDTLSMVAAHPATGVGLGNFSAIIPHFREHSLSPYPIIHPESDWLWIAAEIGVPGLSIMATLVCFMFWMCIPFGDDRLAPVRMAALIAASMFLLHTFFDVTGHQLGVILIAIWVFRMGMPHLKNDPQCLIPAWFWRLGGVVLLAAGAVWIVADLNRVMLQSTVAKEEAFARVAIAMETQQSEGLANDIETSLTFQPLDWELYLQRAQARLYLQNDPNGARNDFLRARKIEPTLVAPAFFEGQVWLPRSTHYAYAAWADAVNRQAENPPYLYLQIIQYARSNPRFARELDQLSQLNPTFRTVYLSNLNSNDFLPALTDTLRRDPKLQDFSTEQREQIMKQWLMHGDPGRMLRYLDTNPEAAPHTWYYRANAYAKLGNYAGAIEEARGYIPVPQIPVMDSMLRRDLKEQRAAFAAQPSDVVRGGALLQAQINQQDVAGAMWTLERLLELENPPPYAYYWMGELLRLQEKYPEAWNRGWQPYLTEVVERKMTVQSAEAEMFNHLPEEDPDQPMLWKMINEF